MTLKIVPPEALRNDPSLTLPVPEQSVSSGERCKVTLYPSTGVVPFRESVTGMGTHVFVELTTRLDEAPPIVATSSEKLAAIV